MTVKPAHALYLLILLFLFLFVSLFASHNLGVSELVRRFPVHNYWRYDQVPYDVPEFMRCTPKRRLEREPVDNNTEIQTVRLLTIISKAFEMTNFTWFIGGDILLGLYLNCQLGDTDDFDIFVFADEFNATEFYQVLHQIDSQSENKPMLYKRGKQFRTTELEYLPGINITTQTSTTTGAFTTYNMIDIGGVIKMDYFWFDTNFNMREYKWFLPYSITKTSFLNFTLPIPYPTVCYLMARSGHGVFHQEIVYQDVFMSRANARPEFNTSQDLPANWDRIYPIMKHCLENVDIYTTYYGLKEHYLDKHVADNYTCYMADCYDDITEKDLYPPIMYRYRKEVLW